ncbi:MULTISPECIES: hypothetical protein [unclassified Nocardiopsis]|uniref:hypothetical protein n=1 Tax=unclassified Nocardiopsis TaxID=2649073 RepID=UPI0013581ECF|nr:MULTISPECIES: hypothetical protein [unclassified Nocardiopsis]
MEPAKLAPYLAQVADDVADSTGHETPVAMARGRRGFALAGLVSVLLDEEAVPTRDAFAVADQCCTLARRALDPLLGPDLVQEHGQGTHVSDIDALVAHGRAELALASDDDVEEIAAAMVTLAARLEELFTHLEQTTTDAEHRRVARACRLAGSELWTAYGGDSGGW